MHNMWKLKLPVVEAVVDCPLIRLINLNIEHLKILFIGGGKYLPQYPY